MAGAPWILRSLLFVPGNRADMIEKAPAYGADALILDLEDGVAPETRPRARQAVAEALERGFPPALPIFVRVNGMTSGLLDEDLRTALRPRVDAVCLPKCHTPEEIQAMNARLQLFEDRWSVARGRFRIIAMIESALGVVNAPAIARCHGRVVALGFGAEDFTADLGVTRTREGGELALARATVSVAAHAAGVDPLDGIYADFRDAEGLRVDTARARSLGYTGKMVIHPSQIGTVHAAFAPSAAEVDHARRVITAFDDATTRGAGIAVVDGAMVDRPIVLRAQRILEIAARSSPGEGRG
jgi:citrate lyase subunit beta / citryl-CoA lyase